MRWIVGMDAQPRSRGALRYARWLAEAGGDDVGPSLVAVRVLDAEHLRFALRRDHLDELLATERAALASEVRRVLPHGGAAEEVVQADTVAEGLLEACARHGATGVAVARAAPRRSHHPFPLGAVARALLRAPARPVLVVPPDLDDAGVGEGPIVAASSLAGDSAEAGRLARAIADAAKRDLTVVHAAGDLAAAAARSGSPPRDEHAVALACDRALARWAERHRIWADTTAILEGDPAAAVVAFAEARRAPLVVVGAAPPHGALGALEPKLWRWLAAHARQAVLVVPAPPQDLASERGAGRPVRGDAPGAGRT